MFCFTSINLNAQLSEVTIVGGATVIFSITLEEDAEINIFDQHGVLTKQLSLTKGQHSLDLDLPVGVYILTDNKDLREKLIVIK